AENDKLRDKQNERFRHRCAKATQHRRRIEMTTQISRCRQRDCHGGEQDGHQRGETEKFLGALERLAHFGTQVAHRLDTLTRCELRREPLAIAVQRTSVTLGYEEPPCRAIAGLQKIGRCNVSAIEKELRTQRKRETRD